MKLRTSYSFKTAVGSLKDCMDRVVEIGLPAAPISDRTSTYGFTRWTKLAKANGLKPVYGVELAVVPELGAKKPIVDFWTFFAIDNLRPLHDLIRQATANPGKEPSILYETAMAAPGLIKITGERTLIDRIQPADDLYIGLSPALPIGLYRRAAKRGFAFIATSDNYYPRAGDREMYRVALGFRSTTQTYPMHILSDAEWRAAAPEGASEADLAAALENRSTALARCSAALSTASLFRPERTATLRELCEAGAARLGVNLNDPAYGERIERELRLIAEKDFEDYFYIISDMIAWAKERMIVGPARGSSCGSLVCYLLGITTIDPLPYGLIFERFIDSSRSDLPDIDIDFSAERRDLVFEYAEQKYGRTHVARLGTVSMLKQKSTMNQISDTLKIPKWELEKFVDTLVEPDAGDERATHSIEDAFAQTDEGRAFIQKFPEAAIATRIEGLPVNAGQHAAGVLITQDDIADYVAIDSRTHATMCDKADAETLNLLKIDALGLKQLSIFERTLQLIGAPDRSGWLEKIPLNDTLAFEVLNNGRFSGIFQFNGNALQSITKQIKVNSFNDIVSITALARPGPAANAPVWIRRRNGEPVSYAHELLRSHLTQSLGIILYQEQVMSIARDIGGMSWTEVTALRKAISKSLGRETMQKYSEPFKRGAMEKGIPAGTVGQIWEDMVSYGSYAFNLSHSVAYGVMSYWCCWLKAHHPAEFAAATLDAEADPMRQIKMLRELDAEGVQYIPFDRHKSTDKWEIAVTGNSKMLLGPLTNVNGIGPAGMIEILRSRRTGEAVSAALEKKLSGGKTEIDTLFPIRDAIKKIDLSAHNIASAPDPVRTIQPGKTTEAMIIGVPLRIKKKDDNDADSVARRGRKVSGPSTSLNLFVTDDTDEILCKISRFDYERIGREIFERGGAGKALYAIRGEVPKGFRMISVKKIRYIGELDSEL